MTELRNPFAPLLGAIVRAIYVATDRQQAMRFDIGYESAPESVYVGTDADCCSETWFADVVGVSNLIGNSNLIGHTVIGIQFLALPDPEDERTRQESDVAYGVRLMTVRGHCDVIYRNSSNGYYGGIAVPMSAEDGAKLEWTPITQDWQA